MGNELRLLFEGKDGACRSFLKASQTSDQSIVVAPTTGVPGILGNWEPPLQVEIPRIDGLHMTVHANGLVHIRENNSQEDLLSREIPPLRDFAGPSYFLHILPAEMGYYPEVSSLRQTDELIPVGHVQDRGFQVLLALGLSDDSNGPPKKHPLPGFDPTDPQKAVKLFPFELERLEVILALTWLTGDRLPPPEHEVWAFVELPEGGDYLPRPLGGTQTRTPWDHLRD